jgi:hypothetical protein
MLAPTSATSGNGRAARASPAVVHLPAPVGTSVGAGFGATTAANPAMGAARRAPGMGSRPQAVGNMDRSGLGPGIERI